MIEPRPCPSCGAGNTHDAAFCWRCYAPFASYAPATAAVAVGVPTPAMPGAPIASGGPMATAPWQQTGGSSLSDFPEPTPVSSWSSRRVLRLLVLAVVVAGGFLAWRSITAGPFPASIRGFDRLDSQPAKVFEKAVADTGAELGISMDGAVYGKAGTMGFMSVMAERTGSMDSLDAAFLKPFPVDRPAVLGAYEEYEVEGASFRCFSYRAEVAGAGCFWLDEETVGFVWAADGLVPQAVELTTAVRTAVT